MADTPTPSTPDDPLAPHRQRIDEVDRQVVALLNDRARAWIDAVRGQYKSRALDTGESQAAERVAEVAGFKFL